MWSPSWKKPIPPASGEAQEAPVPIIASSIINQAIREGAAEICLVPHEGGLRVEYLKGGAWAETMSIPGHLTGPLTEHFKELADLPLGYRMALQGLLPVRQGTSIDSNLRDYDVHLFITPTRQGEKIVMRIEAVGEARG